jgi:hypothetical protein
MTDLLDSVVAAHGGSDRWSKVKSITVDASITGALWDIKRAGAPPKDVRFEVDTTREFLRLDYIGKDKRSVFEPHRVVIEHNDGVLIDSRDDPEKSFDGHQFETPWDDLHLAYFSVRRCGRISTSRFSTTGPHSSLARSPRSRSTAKPGGGYRQHSPIT